MLYFNYVGFTLASDKNEINSNESIGRKFNIEVSNQVAFQLKGLSRVKLYNTGGARMNREILNRDLHLHEKSCRRLFTKYIHNYTEIQ